MPTIEALATEIRGRLGDPSEAELPSAQITRAVEGALREFSRHYPETVEVSVSLSVGVSEYPLPAGTVDVSESASDGLPYTLDFPTSEFGFTRPGVDEGDLDFWRAIGRDYLYGRGDLELDLQVIETGDEESPAPVLRIIPTPALAGTLALVVEKVRDPVKLTRKDVEGLVQWAEGDCMEYIGRKRSKSVTDVPTATGRLKLSDGQDLREEGRKQKEKQESKWGTGATVIEGG
jgi:hypothetical protein